MSPVDYFLDIVQNNDTFAMLFDEIIDKREEGVLIEYQDHDSKTTKALEAFLIVQDRHGVHWVCPVHIDPKKKIIEQDVTPLNLKTDVIASAYRQNVRFGSMKIDKESYIGACSRGFENASFTFLGKHHVQLLPDYNLSAAFYFFPKEGK